MVFSNFPIYNFFELDHLNILSYTPLLKETNKIKTSLIENWNNSNQMLISFQNKLYYDSGPDFYDMSWDLYSGVKTNHDYSVKRLLVYDFAFTDVNEKIWRTGGISEDEPIKQTFFLLSNFSWINGPQLPEAKESHTMVTISENEVLIFGGDIKGVGKNSANRVWLYNDQHNSFEIRKDFELGFRPSAAMTYIKKLARKAILVLVKERAYFYDVARDAWIHADDSWIHPIPKFEQVKIFATSDDRLYF